MSLYNHFSIEEREKMLKLRIQGKGVREIGRLLNRSPSSISREFNRNGLSNEDYSAIKAQRQYENRRRKSRRKKLLDNMDLKDKVQKLFLKESWSPEQISNRLSYEETGYQISYTTIYRAIQAGEFDMYLPGDKKASRKLRHRGKTRRTKGRIETRGKIKVTHTIHERPCEADNRKVIGHWEADTVVGKTNSACIVTMVDRASRYLLADQIQAKKSDLVKEKIIELFLTIPKVKRRSVTPDRGKEFSRYSEISEELEGLRFYFSDPHSPWQRGTNENTNGLLREYFPKGTDISVYSDEVMTSFIDKINKRPRKCLGWKTPHEVFFNEVLHLT
jgi:transposase, IS30 family